MRAALRELTGLLPSKRAAALAVSLDALLELSPQPRNEKIAPETRNVLMAVFDLLPKEKQMNWLSEMAWYRLSDPAWIPVLRRLASRSIAVHYPLESETYWLVGVSSLALQHWYELDRDGARPMVLTELTRPEPRYTASQLSYFSDAVLPEDQQAIADHLVEASNSMVQRNLSELLARYADLTVEATVLPLLDNRRARLDCAVQINLIGWYLRTHAVDEARRLEGVFAVCGATMFYPLGSIVEHEALERLAIGALDDADWRVATGALGYLRDHGSARAKEPIADRLRRWNQQWGNRSAELALVDPRNDPHGGDRALGTELSRALACARGWLADEAQLRRILPVVLTDSGKQQVEALLYQAKQRPVPIYSAGRAPVSFSIGCYNLDSTQALKDKLLHYPPETQFVLHRGWVPGADVLNEEWTRQLEQWGQAHGRPVTVAPDPRRKTPPSHD